MTLKIKFKFMQNKCMYMNDIIIRSDPAKEISNKLCLDILETYKASEIAEWHSFQLVNLYISSRDNTEIDIQLNRSFKSKIEFNIDIVPDESVDKLSDTLIDTIRINLKKYILQNSQLDINFDENEYITTINISRSVKKEKDSFSENEYTIRFDTEKRDSIIIKDYKMHKSPRIAGKRILVSDIYNQYTKLSDFEGFESIVNEMNNLVTVDEVEKAIEFAENSDEITNKEDIVTEGVDLEPMTKEELEESLSKDLDLDLFDDNR